MQHIKAHAKHVHHSRHAHLGVHSTSAHPGYAHGGHPHAKHHSHPDAAEDRAMIKHMVKPEALKRAHGGKVHKGKGSTHVNIMVGHPGGAGAAPAPMPPMAAPPPAARPPMPMPPPGGPVGGPPPGIGGVAGPMRKRGGSVGRR